MDTIVKAASVVARVLALLGAIAVVVMMLHICLDVVLRNLFRYSFSSTNAMVARYYMVPLAFLPLAYIELRDEMVSVELIDGFLPRWLRQASDALVALIACGIYGTLTWATWGSMVSNWSRGTMIELGEIAFLTYPSYVFPTVGFALATAACLIKAADRARQIGDPA
ncbi:TRAP transporter small permease [Marivita sp.]|uniref:TRAP transporter small permease n=1 Tax=Marivita sp. TaxID=2003365 RepID=UPI0025BB58FE|nr:TRAP transporter small permease [Marivita sp.]